MNKEKNTTTQKSTLRLYITGFFMGTADLIPGVSGGTVAFISGIYEELLESIKTVSGKTIKLLLQFKIKEAIAVTPLRFLIAIFAGIFTAILSLANLLSYLLANYPSFVWAFFFGLVLASIWIITKKISSWNISKIIAFLATAFFSYFLVGSIPVESPENILMFFLSGMIAICAMILPGISGSFILLIIGKYSQILAAVRTLDLVTLISVALGAVFGLAIFSRFLSWLFKEHHDISVSILSGFMLGSLRKLWPWQEVILTRVNSHGETVALATKNLIPQNFDLNTILVIVMIMAGVAIMVVVDKLDLS